MLAGPCHPCVAEANHALMPQCPPLDAHALLTPFRLLTPPANDRLNNDDHFIHDDHAFFIFFVSSSSSLHLLNVIIESF